MSKTLTDISFLDLLPASISSDPVIVAAARALDGELAKTTANINAINIWSRIDEIEEPLLSMLAWELHVDYWDQAWPDSAKRETIKKAYILHMIKGTPAAVVEAIKTVWNDAEIEEWFEYDGAPGYFRAYTDETLSAEMIDRFVEMINAYKNCRSWLDKLGVKRGLDCSLNVGLFPRLGGSTRIAPRFEADNLDAALIVGTYLQHGRTTRVPLLVPKITADDVAVYVGGRNQIGKLTRIGVSNG